MKDIEENSSFEPKESGSNNTVDILKVLADVRRKNTEFETCEGFCEYFDELLVNSDYVFFVGEDLVDNMLMKV